MKTITKIIDFINRRIVGSILILMMAIMSIIIIMQVLFRLLNLAVMTWTEELARYLMIYITFLGMAYACKSKELARIEYLDSMLRGLPRKIIGVFVLLVQISFFSATFTAGIEIMKKVFAQKSPAMQISMAIPYGAMMIGCLFALINCIYDLAMQFVKLPEPDNGEEEH